ncbi:S-(hydroxymethyl)glutathione synthase [Synchytrium endobioticum]|nr:S-(hydroxymethyl)glutathione synthase [Synchytrium endobioticum]
MKLEGSCRCNRVRFTVESNCPYPYMKCYCDICRKCQGGGGFAINIHALKATLKVEGDEYINTWSTISHPPDDSGDASATDRRSCRVCASCLWCYCKENEECIYPFASCIDTPLPKSPEIYHILLKYKPDWVELPVKEWKDKQVFIDQSGVKHIFFKGYPDEGIWEWHDKRRLLVDDPDTDRKDGKEVEEGDYEPVVIDHEVDGDADVEKVKEEQYDEPAKKRQKK